MSWSIKGELILNCNCTVFCPCVVSLGEHPPTEGYCQGWIGVRIDEGEADGEDLSGLNVGMIIDIPGNLGRGNWSAAAYIDERASDAAYTALVEIFSGQRRGTTGLFSLLVSTFLGAERAPVIYENEGEKRRLTVGKKIIGEVEPISGADPDAHVRITNTEYWMGPDITVASANKGRVRAFGRVWNFEGRSAEICAIDWQG
ncbi:MAG: DUF1326 domain-containing protein [Paracoccaceae bacterium]